MPSTRSHYKTPRNNPIQAFFYDRVEDLPKYEEIPEQFNSAIVSPKEPLAGALNPSYWTGKGPDSY